MNRGCYRGCYRRYYGRCLPETRMHAFDSNECTHLISTNACIRATGTPAFYPVDIHGPLPPSKGIKGIEIFFLLLAEDEIPLLQDAEVDAVYDLYEEAEVGCAGLIVRYLVFFDQHWEEKLPPLGAG